MASVVTLFEESFGKPDFDIRNFLKKNKKLILQLDTNQNVLGSDNMLVDDYIRTSTSLIQSAMPANPAGLRPVYFFVSGGGESTEVALKQVLEDQVQKWDWPRLRKEKKERIRSFPPIFVLIANGQMHWTTHIFIGLNGAKKPMLWSMNSMKRLWSEVTKYLKKFMGEQAKEHEIHQEQFGHQQDGYACGYFSILYTLLFAMFWRWKTDKPKTYQVFFKIVDKYVQLMQKEGLFDVFKSFVRVVAYEKSPKKSDDNMAQFIESQLGV